MSRVLVIDNEAMIVNLVQTILASIGIETDGSSDPREGVSLALANDYDLVLSDLRMPGMNGAEVTRAILEARPNARILIITGHPTHPLARDALEAGAVSILKKPFDVTVVREFLEDRGDRGRRP